jgi:hypothetical protein
MASLMTANLCRFAVMNCSGAVSRRECETNNTAFSHLRFDDDVSVVAVNDLSTGMEAKPVSKITLCAEERREEMLLVSRTHAAAHVSNQCHHLNFSSTGAHVDLAANGDGVD